MKYLDMSQRPTEQLKMDANEAMLRSDAFFMVTAYIHPNGGARFMFHGSYEKLNEHGKLMFHQQVQKMSIKEQEEILKRIIAKDSGK